MPPSQPGRLRITVLALAPLALLAAVAALSLASLPAAQDSPSSPAAWDDGCPQALPPAPPAPPVIPARLARPAPPEPPDPPSPRSHRRPHAYDDDEDEYDRDEERAWLGVNLSEIEDEGARISRVEPDSPADEAGLRRGDIIREIDGRQVISSQDVVRAVRRAAKGDRMKLTIERDGEEMTLDATLSSRRIRTRSKVMVFTPGPDDDDDDDEDLPMRAPRVHVEPLMGGSGLWLGVEVLPMSEDLRAGLGAPRGRGVLVDRVVEDSPAAEAGLKAADIIVSVDGQGISRVGDIHRALREHDEGDRVVVKVIRDGSERSLDVSIADRPGHRRRSQLLVPGFRWHQGVAPAPLSEEQQREIETSIREAMEQVREAMEQVREGLSVEQGEIREKIREALEASRFQIEAQQREYHERMRDELRALRESMRRSQRLGEVQKAVYDL